MNGITVGASQRILVIDNDRTVCDIISRTLTKRGYEVATAARHQEGVRKAGETLPDLVFISLLLRDSNGLKVSKEIHTLDGLNRVPVVMTVSYKGELDPKYTRSIGIVDVLIKPLQESDIIAKTEAVIGPVVSADKPEETESGEKPPAREHTEEQDESYILVSADEAEGGPSRLDAEYDVVPAMPDDETGRMHKPQEVPDARLTITEDVREEMTGQEGLRLLSGGADEQSEQEGAVRKALPDILPEETGVEEMQKGGDMSFDTVPAGSPPKKRIFLAGLLLTLVAVAGIAAYVGLRFFASEKSEVILLPAVKEEVRKDGPALEQAVKEPVPQEGTGQSLDAKVDIPSVPAAGEGAPKEKALEEPVGKAEKVRDAAVKTPSGIAVKASASTGKETFSVQIGFFGNLKNAESLAAKMKQRGYQVVIRPEGKEGEKISYRAIVGKFSSRKEAQEQADVIFRKEGMKTILYKE